MCRVYKETLSLRTIKICRFEIIDGVEYVYCIKHAYKFLLREQISRVCDRSLTLASMCFFYYDGAVDLQIWALCIVSGYSGARGPLVSLFWQVLDSKDHSI